MSLGTSITQELLTLKALANFSPGLLQPWVIVVAIDSYATLKGLRRSRGIANRRNSFRVAKSPVRHSCSQGFKANPGLEFANAFSVAKAEFGGQSAVTIPSGLTCGAFMFTTLCRPCRL